jgi:TonB family protein
MPAIKFAPSSQETSETPVAPAATRVLFSPSLASRAPKPALESLRVEGPAPQQATVLRVAVDAIGVVRYALLAESSGSTAVDNRSLQQVQTWRFQSAERPADALDWGEVRILWAGGGETTAPPVPAPGGGGTP